MHLLLSTLFLTVACLLSTSPQAIAQAPAPTTQWDKTFGGSDLDGLEALQQTSDGGYILGGGTNSGISGDKTQGNQGSGDYWIVKLDANGIKQWDKTFGGSDQEYFTALQQTTDGGYILGGRSSSSIGGDKTQPSQGEVDYWVVKLDANGAKQWDKTFGGNNLDNLLALQQTSDGGYMLGGQSNSGISGDKTQGNQGEFDYWVVKLDASGTKQWDKTFGGRNMDGLEALQQTSDGGYILGGFSNSDISGDKTQGNQGSQGGYDYWVIKLDANGTTQWDKTFGGNKLDGLNALQQTSDGGYILGGWSDSDSSGDKTQASQGYGDYWVVKLDANGIKQWDKTFGGSDLDNLTGLQQTRDGGYILGGESYSDNSGDKTQGNQGRSDYWVVKLGALPLATTSATPRPTLCAYPNPTRTQFTLRGPLGTPYQLLDQFGHIVRLGQVSAQPLDVQTLPAGLYLLRDTSSGRTSKLMKE
ncbi:T9SS type A sorting domain-containing protein [Hymenobacter sp. YC55]|uniref:T9SS type A sorting domain-containing protein n=1 Tax=Hymenobacter sp. YC55 TaxID=3034019 RepID=UPI0023F7CA17|nr:T9SS type A sorting domain-containing protein [Hymenobacter sp. YC55]MDF7815219.1 T9SS type A sorting domain-containing protein [Hymenobacter sp. YC55]